MSLSRPVKFPLVKLPFLCIEAVIKSWNTFDIIFFALISERTRRIVKSLRIPLNRIKIVVSRVKWIMLGNDKWHFRNESESLCNEQYLSKNPLVLQKNAAPLYTRKTDDYLESYSDENEVAPLIMAMEFLTEVFKCSVEAIHIYGGYFPELGNIGVKSTVNLCLNHLFLYPFGYSQNRKLNLLLENLEVTGTCYFSVATREKGFYCDPNLFKCKKLVFRPHSTAWVTRDTLLQFEVPKLKFEACPFSVQDIVSFVTQWFYSDNRKFEYLHIPFEIRQSFLKTFRADDLNPLPFSGSNRVPLTESFSYIDFSKGLEIVRHDGLQATIHANDGSFLFYIWHDQPAVTPN